MYAYCVYWERVVFDKQVGSTLIPTKKMEEATILVGPLQTSTYCQVNVKCTRTRLQIPSFAPLSEKNYTEEIGLIDVSEINIILSYFIKFIEPRVLFSRSIRKSKPNRK